MDTRSFGIRPLLFMLGVLLAGVIGCTGSKQAQEAAPAAADPSVVALIDGEPLTIDEFERRYARSKGSREQAASDSLAAYQDFLERYVDFRLKVLAAKEAGYADDPALQQEVQTYRMNLGRPYLMEEEVMDPIIRDLYDKSKEVIDASHILIRVPPEATPEDTLAAYQRLYALRDSVMQGADFGTLARRHSEDPSARMQGRRGFEGHLGFFGPGQLIEAFEDTAYATPVGEVSDVFRTRFGYHIIKVNDRRAKPADIRVSHILIRPQGNDAAAQDSARAQTEAIQQQLAAGADFGELAQQHSQDPGSAGKGGDLGYLNLNTPVVESFKNAAFAIDSVGAVSDVVETQFGYHLIKLTERKELPTYDEAYDDLKKMAQQLPRTQEAQQALASRALQRWNAQIDTAAVVQVFGSLDPDTAMTRLVSGELGTTQDSSFATLGDSIYAFARLSEFAGTRQLPGEGTSTERVLALIDPFMQEAALNYEAANLEEENEAFRTVMQEFRDGLLLFKLMEDSVWTAATQDTAALQQYFEVHKEDYRYPERTRIITLTSPSDSVLAAIGERMDGGLTIAALEAELAQDSTQSVRLDTMRISGATNSIYDQALSLQQGGHTQPIKHQRQYVMLIHDGTEAPRAMTFEEARAEMANAYQEVLEERLLRKLREQYNVRTFPERLARAFSQDDPVAAGEEEQDVSNASQ